jgi:hypothetical protein
LRHLTLEDIALRYPTIDDPALQGSEHGGMQFSPGVPWARTARAAFVFANVHHARLTSCRVLWPDAPGQAQDTPAWTWPRKAANGTLRWFEPSDWQLLPGKAFAAVAQQK